MRHQVHGKKLNRSVAHRKALYANLVQSLVEYERITTTVTKAKAVRPVVEKLITTAKRQDLAARREILASVPVSATAKKMYEVLGPRFASRPGGYTRIIKVGRRSGDGTEMAVLELVELTKPVKVKKTEQPGAKKPAKKVSRAKSEEKPADSQQPVNPSVDQEVAS